MVCLQGQYLPELCLGKIAFHITLSDEKRIHYSGGDPHFTDILFNLPKSFNFEFHQTGSRDKWNPAARICPEKRETASSPKETSWSLISGKRPYEH
jgi:hypothetical protein